jgi:iron complex transport system ATP-binding protein
MLDVDGVSVELGGATIVDDVTATVAQGRWLGLVGPNGAGKTTLLRAVAGLVEYCGDVRVASRRLHNAPRRETARLVAYVPQRPTLPMAMPLTDYLLLGRAAHHTYLGGSTRRDRHVVAAVLDRLDLTSFATRPLGTLSGGEAQRAVFGRALAQEAPVLLLDEPTASLDLGHGQLVLELADELRRERGLTVLCAIHDLTLAAQYSDTLLVLSAGCQVAYGSPAEVLTEASVERIFGACVEIHVNASGLAVTPVRPSVAAGDATADTHLRASVS